MWFQVGWNSVCFIQNPVDLTSLVQNSLLSILIFIPASLRYQKTVYNTKLAVKVASFAIKDVFNAGIWFVKFHKIPTILDYKLAVSRLGPSYNSTQTMQTLSQLLDPFEFLLLVVSSMQVNHYSKYKSANVLNYLIYHQRRTILPFQHFIELSKLMTSQIDQFFSRTPKHSDTHTHF